MSIWEYLAVVEGYRQAHDPDAGKELSSAEVDDLWDFINR